MHFVLFLVPAKVRFEGLRAKGWMRREVSKSKANLIYEEKRYSFYELETDKRKKEVKKENRGNLEGKL